MFDNFPLQHPATPPAPLLIAALALLHRRCPRNELNAARLLQRAASSITPSRRNAKSAKAGQKTWSVKKC